MSPEKKRIAIATACGWTDIRRQRLYRGDQDLWGNKLIGGEKHRNRLPDYPSDLNACHEMEKVLTHDQWPKYFGELRTVILGGIRLVSEWCKADLHATAAEKCEAFLRTLGLWEEEQ